MKCIKKEMQSRIPNNFTTTTAKLLHLAPQKIRAPVPTGPQGHNQSFLLSTHSCELNITVNHLAVTTQLCPAPVPLVLPVGHMQSATPELADTLNRFMVPDFVVLTEELRIVEVLSTSFEEFDPIKRKVHSA